MHKTEEYLYLLGMALLLVLVVVPLAIVLAVKEWAEGRERNE